MLLGGKDVGAGAFRKLIIRGRRFGGQDGDFGVRVKLFGVKSVRVTLEVARLAGRERLLRHSDDHSTSGWLPRTGNISASNAVGSASVPYRHVGSLRRRAFYARNRERPGAVPGRSEPRL